VRRDTAAPDNIRAHAIDGTTNGDRTALVVCRDSPVKPIGWPVALAGQEINNLLEAKERGLGILPPSSKTP